MEANRTPKEIYVDNSNHGIWCHTKDENSIENIHADAIIEKACTNLKKLMYGNLMFEDRLHHEEVSDNFVENFKSIRKGNKQ